MELEDPENSEIVIWELLGHCILNYIINVRLAFLSV